MALRNGSTQGVPAAPAAGARWRALLSGLLADRTAEVVDLLVERLDRRTAGGQADASLASGSAGLAVCHATLARVRGDSHAADRARVLLDETIDDLASRPQTAWLYAGFTGVAFAAQVVDRLLGDDDGGRNDEIDEALAGLVRRYPDQAGYELIYGLTGLGVYSLSRWPRPVAVESLEHVADHLLRSARFDRDGAFWWTPPSLLLGDRREQCPQGMVDLGVAHGMAAVLPLLGRLRALGVAGEEVASLLDAAVDWLSAHLLPTPSGPTVPYFVADGVAATPARTAWCYGDPGVATALLLAAHDASRPAWTELAIDLALEAAVRPPGQSGVTDAGLCHGAAGLAHLFNRMYQMTGIPELRDAARSWVERTLDMSAPVLGRGAALTGPPSPPWNGPGLLEGAAGIALALLAASTETEPMWDSMLLVSTPGPLSESAA